MGLRFRVTPSWKNKWVIIYIYTCLNFSSFICSNYIYIFLWKKNIILLELKKRGKKSKKVVFILVDKMRKLQKIMKKGWRKMRKVVHPFIPIVSEEEPIIKGIMPPISVLLQLKKWQGALWPMFFDATNEKWWGHHTHHLHIVVNQNMMGGIMPLISLLMVAIECNARGHDALNLLPSSCEQTQRWGTFCTPSSIVGTLEENWKKQLPFVTIF